MKLSSSKIISDHLLLCVFLSLLWGVTDSSTTDSTTDTTPTATLTSATEAATTTARLTTQLTTIPTTKAPPGNVHNVTVLTQNETSITLLWIKVGNISNYAIKFSEREISVTASEGSEQVTESIPGLRSGTKYDFTLFTVFENVRSSGKNFSAATAPGNVHNVTVLTQNESSITLMWDKVNNIPTYFLLYDKEDTINASLHDASVTHVVTPLDAGRKYNFTLITASEGVNSTGYSFDAVTAPPNTDDFKSVGQNETSITLQWTKVGNISNYTIKFSEREINVTASEGSEQVTESIPGLRSGTKYDFTLFTVFENVSSSGKNLSAATAPGNVHTVTVLTQNETSITLQWTKVGNISNYALKFSEGEISVTASEGSEQVTESIPGLRSGTKYDFTLFTVFENVRSSGKNLSAATAPGNVHNVTVLTQNESSITLMWDKVNNIPTYFLQYDKEDTINASLHDTSVTHVVTPLDAGRKYDFTLITASEGVNSTGYSFDAVTAPPNTDDFKSVGQNETSITLQWIKVGNISNYTLKFSEREISITASEGSEQVTESIPGLRSGTKYDFTLFTVFENVRSSGKNLSAATAPGNVHNVTVLTQNETSITLMWDKVNNIPTYFLQYDKEDTINASLHDASVTHVVTPLDAGRKYDFTLITASEGVNSTGYSFDAVTAPPNTDDFKSVGQNETSITLQWTKVGNISNYTIKFSEREINVTASEGSEQVTESIPGLRSGTKYDFTLFTVFENVSSSGKNFSAATAPGNVHNVTVLTQNETSITLMWDKVNNIPTYFLQYDKEDTINASLHDASVTHVVTPLDAGRKYDFTLITASEGVNSTGYSFDAVTAPPNTDDFKSVGQNETSITLQWTKVGNISNYALKFSEREISVTASEGSEQVTESIPGLRSGTKYDFTLFTVFENVSSSGKNLSAATAPGNVHNVTVLTQNETSITLMWDKVNDISTYFLLYDNNGEPTEVKGDLFYQETSVRYEVSSLNAGTKYDFTLITGFEKVNSTGFSFNATTVPSEVALVNVTERSMTSITLTWQKEKKDWDYFLQFDGVDVKENQPFSRRAEDVESYLILSLQPGTEYRFRVITGFSGLNSTTYEDFTVTTINCTWRVTTSSIEGSIEGLFSNATANNKSQTIVSPGGSNVSFTGLYPGATYEVYLEYERNSKTFPQCRHKLTTIPLPLTGECANWGAGYSALIILKKPDSLWTEVEVNMNGKISTIEPENGEQLLIRTGLLPARTYEVSLRTKSQDVWSKPYDFECQTDPRGVIAGSVVAVLLFCLLVCLAVFLIVKRPDIIRQKTFIGGSKQTKQKIKAIPVAKFPDHFHQLGTDENRGFSEEYESLIPVGTEQTRKAAIAPENKSRNRFNNVLPYDWCRVKLTSSPSGASDYINASYMPGYNSNREYIASQGPLPSTVGDFWRMIWEQRVKGIVMVTNCTEGGKTKCERYWPADSKPCSYGELLVTIRSEQEAQNWTLREFRVKHGNSSEERTVKHFHFTAWPDHGVPQGTEILIQFRELVRQHIEREAAGTPTVVHCSAGVGRTGTIIALDVLLQQLERERAVGINGFVQRMRLSRPHMVQTESQYVFLHQSIMDCLQPNEKPDENIYENADMIYANATALRELR